MSKFKNLKELEEAYKELEEELADMQRSKLAWENKYFKLEKQLAEKNKKLEIASLTIGLASKLISYYQEYLS